MEIGKTRMQSSDFWGTEFEQMRSNPELWTSNKDVERYIYRCVTGGEEIHWLPWVFDRLNRDAVPLSKVLSVGCGDGEHEKHMLGHDAVSYVHGMDGSPGAIDIAKAKLSEVARSLGKSFEATVEDLNFLDLNEQSFDAVACIHIAHHITDLDNLFYQLHGALAQTGGPLVLMEYIGPNRFQWTNRQVRLIERLRSVIAEEFLNDHGQQVFKAPDYRSLLALDHSEACSSEDIMKYLLRHFNVSYQSFYNGAVLHPIYGLLDSSHVGETGFDTLVQMLIAMDELFSDFGVLAPDFTFLIAWPKDEAKTPN